MDTAKPALRYKISNYEISVNLFSAKCFSASIIDHELKCEYNEPNIELKRISANTVMKAFEKSQKQITLQFSKRVIEESHILQICFKIQSPFLSNLEETICLKRVREVDQTELITSSINHLNCRIKELKEDNQGASACKLMQEPRRYSSAAAESILSLKLTKGRYLLTISCIVKAHNQWFYIYFKNQPMWTHGGYYLPATEQNMSFLVRKVYEATSEDEVVDISTISASSYQVTLSNVIITARKLVEQK